MRHGRQRVGSPALAVLRYLGIAVAVVAVSSTSIAAIAVESTLANIKPGVHLSQLAGIKAVPPPQVGAISGPVNLLLTGTDSRLNQVGFQDRADLRASSGAGNNDVTMVLHISSDHQHATVVSIPRDLLVTIPRCPRSNGTTYGSTNMSMFNTALSHGGLNCVVLAAEQLTGLNIQYGAEISFDGVIGMSDAVGGVTVCLASPVKDPYVGLNLPAGQQTIVGVDALAFVRSRHGVGDGSDLGRISNQQVFLSALMRKITSAGVLSNPITLYTIANAALKNMQFSDTLAHPDTMVAIALALKSIPLNNIVFVQYPAKGNPLYPGRVVPSEPYDSILNNALDNDQPVYLTGKVGRAAVLGPATPVTVPTPSPTSSGTKKGTSTPTPTPTPPPASSVAPVALPSNISGQTAAQNTCTKGN